MSSNNDGRKFKASNRGKPYSVYWKTSETHPRNNKIPGPMKPTRGVQFVKEEQKQKSKDDSKAVANQESSRPTLRELCPADKQRVRKLIEQLAEAGSERQRIEGVMKDERKQFGELLGKLRKQYQKVVQEKNQLQDELHSSQLHLQSLHTVPVASSMHETAAFNMQHDSSTQGSTPKQLNVESILSMPAGQPRFDSLPTSVNSSAHVPSSVHVQPSNNPSMYCTEVTMAANQQGFSQVLLPQKPIVSSSRFSASVGHSEIRTNFTSSITSSTISSTSQPVASTETNMSFGSPRMGAYVQAQYPNYFPPPPLSQPGPTHLYKHPTHQFITQSSYKVPQHPLPQYSMSSSLNTATESRESTSHNNSMLPPLQSSLLTTDSTLNTSQFHLPHPTVHSTQAAVAATTLSVPPHNSLSTGRVSNKKVLQQHEDNTEKETCVHSHMSTEDQSFSVKSWKSLPTASPVATETETTATTKQREHDIVQRDVCTQTLNVESIATQTHEDSDLKDVEDEDTKVSNKRQRTLENTVGESSIDATTTTLSVSDLQQIPAQIDHESCTHQRVNNNVTHKQSLSGTPTNQTVETSFIPPLPMNHSSSGAPIVSGESDRLLEELVTGALLNAQGTLFSLQTLSRLHGSTCRPPSNKNTNSSKNNVQKQHREIRSPSPLELAESLNSHPYTHSLLSNTKSHDLTTSFTRMCHGRSQEVKQHRRDYSNHKTRVLNLLVDEQLSGEEGADVIITSSSSPQSISNSETDDSELIEDLFFI